MQESGVVLRRTSARKVFKQNHGQANHFLITLLVGLDAVRDGVATPADTFSATWVPLDRERSADRTRDFALRSTLASTIDAVDSYIRLLVPAPSPIAALGVRKQLDELGNQQLAHRVSAIAGVAEDLQIEVDLIALAVLWRNSLVHFVSDPVLDEECERRLIDAEDVVHARYQGLGVSELIDRFRRHSGKVAPRFKELAGFNAAAHTLVRSVDSAILSQMVASDFFIEWLRKFAKDRDNRITATWGKDHDTRQRALWTLAREAGFSPIKPDEFEYDLDGAVLSASEVQRIAAWSVVQARIELAPSRASTKRPEARHGCVNISTLSTPNSSSRGSAAVPGRGSHRKGTEHPRRRLPTRSPRHASRSRLR